MEILEWKRRHAGSAEDIHFDSLTCTETLKGHGVLWKIEICYLIRMT